MSDDRRIDPAVVASLYVEHGEELRRFLFGVLRNDELVGEAFQAAFVKAIEQGHTANCETLKGWLFKVAFHEALTLKRRAKTGQRVLEKWVSRERRTEEMPATRMLRVESVEAVQKALEELPAEQAVIVRKRIYESQTFAEIAEEFNLPLGTVLSRMQLALKKLRKSLNSKEDEDV